MWELDYKESWALKNWCFWTAVLEKILESPLDCKEIQPVHSKGDQPWVFFGRNDDKAETPVLWPPHMKSCLIGEGNGNPLRCSCLEDPRDGRAWRAAVYGVTQSRTWLKRLSSSRFIITFLPRSKHLSFSWLQSPSAVILEPPKIKSATVSTGSPSICLEVMGPVAMILVFWILSFKPTFSLSCFMFFKRLF